VYCGKYGLTGADAIEFDGRPEAGYGKGTSPKTTPSVQARIVVHNMYNAMLKSFMKLI
jgi:hypothetical protein